MNGHITGTAEIRFDGESLETVDNGLTAKPGGYSRSTKVGNGSVRGFTEETVPAELQVRIAHKKETSLKRIANIRNATVLVRTDTGQRHIYRGAWSTEPPELDINNGEVSFTMNALEHDEDS